jgi:hypothetical protein
MTETVRGILIPIEGGTSWVEFTNSESKDLRILQDAVGGYAESLSFQLVNGEQVYILYPEEAAGGINARANSLAGMLLGGRLPDRFIEGPAIVIGADDSDLANVPSELLAQMVNWDLYPRDKS